MHFRILLGGHYHLVCLKLHGAAVLVLLGVVLVLDKAAFHGALAITLKDVPDQVGKALVGAGTGAFDLIRIGNGGFGHLLIIQVLYRLLTAAGQFVLHILRGHSGHLGELHTAVGVVCRFADAERSKDGFDLGFGLAHHLAFLCLNQLGDHQVVAADVLPTIFRPVVGPVDAGVGIPGHITIGSHFGALGVDLIATRAVTVGTGRPDLHNVGLHDLLSECFLLRLAKAIVVGSLFCFIQIGIEGFISCPVFVTRVPRSVRVLLETKKCNLAGVILHRIVEHCAGDLVESTLVRMLVLAALVLVVAIALSTFVVKADLFFQTHICVARVIIHQLIGIVVPLQGRVDQHAIRAFAVLRLQLCAGCKVKVLDFGGFHPVDIHLIPAPTVLLPVVITAVVPIPMDFLVFYSLTVLCVVGLIASVVVGQFFLVLLAVCIDRDHLILGGLGLRLQGCFQLLRGHISLRDVFLDILNDILLYGFFCDLKVTDKEGLAVFEPSLFLRDLVPQFLIGCRQLCIVRGNLLPRCIHTAFDLQNLLFQVGAVNRNRGTVLRKGGGGAVSVQRNGIGRNTELLCQHCLGFLRRQNIFFLFRSGIGDLFVVLVSTGEVALFILCIGLAVIGQGVAVRCNCPILVAVISDRFTQLLRFIGLFLGGLGHRPRHGGSIIKPDIGIACGCQFRL